MDEIKKKYTNLTADILDNVKENLVTLPDGFEVDISSFINSTPDNMFNPKDLDHCVGLVDMIENAVKLEDDADNIHYASIMYNNMVLSGGNT